MWELKSCCGTVCCRVSRVKQFKLTSVAKYCLCHLFFCVFFDYVTSLHCARGFFLADSFLHSSENFFFLFLLL